jgi:regulator of nucleoside diphosphate kinase
MPITRRIAMKNRLPQLTELDVARLEKHAAHDSRFQHMLDALLERADIVQQHIVNANVVTMNSRITLIDESSQTQTTWTIVYPTDADLEQGRLNVFSPVGMALLGTRRGERVNVLQPGGTEKRMTVAAIEYQPEACGDYTR